MKSYFAMLIRAGRLKEPTDVSPVVWNRSGSQQRCAVRKSFVDGTDVVSIAAPPRCPIETTCNQVNMLTNHNGSDCEDELFWNTPFFGVDTYQYAGTEL